MIARLMDSPPRRKRQVIKPSGVRLDPDMIIRAARALADREGSAALTLRRLGADMGTDPTALYRHFRSKSDLIVAIADRVFEEARDEIRLGDDWRANLRAMIIAGWRVYGSHPGLAEALARQPDDTPSLARAADLTIQQLRRAGLSDRDSAWTYHTLIDLMAGTGVFNAIAPDLAVPPARAALRRSFLALPPEIHPDAVAVAEHLFPDVDDVFEFTVDLVLDAIELRGKRTLEAERGRTRMEVGRLTSTGVPVSGRERPGTRRAARS